jgi:mycothiol S-conjugate amidase
MKCHQVSLDAFHAAGDARAYPEAGPSWPVAKLYAVAQIDDGQWETLRPAFQAAGFDMGGRQRDRKRARGAGPETATVALDVRPYSEIQRQALLAHRTQIPQDSLWRRLPAELYRRAFATAYCLRLHPPAAPGESEQDLFEGLDIKARKE